METSGLKLKVLAYGASGTGKTRFAATFPKPYFFDFDGGMLSLRKVQPQPKADLYADTYRNGVLIESAAQRFERVLAEKEVDGSIETVVIDSVTTLQDSMMRDILKVNNRAEPTLHEWGRLIDRLIVLLLRMKALPKHIVVTAHEEPMKDEVTGEIVTLPLIVGRKLPQQMPLYFDEVYRTQVVADSRTGVRNYILNTQATTRYTAKSRLDCLDPVMPTSFAAIWERVKASE